jgi:hypothetical protein
MAKESEVQTLQLILRHLKGIVSALEKYLEQLKNEAVR